MNILCKTVILEELKEREPLFGRWSVGKFLGAGANGCVFTIEREDLGQKFVAAIKVIPLSAPREQDDPTGATLRETIGKDAREILHMYNLAGHTNIVGWHNHDILTSEDEDSIHVHIVVMMDYLPNSLARELKKGPLPWQSAVEILIGCLRGLEHIHARNIVHRDIKPENIFIAADGTPKIGDFGISRQVSDATQARTVAGTPLYMAPEVYSDPFGTGYGLRCDIYSLGLVGYEMIEGYLPFEGDSDTTQGMVQRRFAGEPIEFSAITPAPLKKALLRALAYDPERRFPTVQAFRQALERLLQPQQMNSLLPGAKLFSPPPLSQLAESRNAPPKRLVRSRTAPPSGNSPQGEEDARLTATAQTRTFLSLGGVKHGPRQEDPSGTNYEATQTMRVPLRRPQAEAKAPPGHAPRAPRPNPARQQAPAEARQVRPRKAELDVTVRTDQTLATGKSAKQRPSLIGDTLNKQEHAAGVQKQKSNPTTAKAVPPQEEWEEVRQQPLETASPRPPRTPGRESSPYAQTLADTPIGKRTMVRMLEADTAVNFIFYSSELCQKLVDLAKEMIRQQGYVPLEYKNRFSSRVNEEKVCARIISIGMVEGIILAEIIPLEAYEHDLAHLLEHETYQVVPKYLGFTYNLGENTHIRPDHLQLLSFSIYDKIND